MSYRRHPIYPNQIYHVFNRGIAQQPIFFGERDYQRFTEVCDFYRFIKPDMRFSYYNRLSQDEKSNFIRGLRDKGQRLIEIYAFCLIPNHFHFLLKELIEKGTEKFVGNLQNSYAKYVNTKRKRTGALFQEKFKAIRIESDEQFLHVARYIHLNPYSSFLLKNLDQLKDYRWSSLGDYLNDPKFAFLDKKFLNSFYSSKEKLMSFIFDQADYQRRLEEIKHLTFE